jgi:hypothetical protein
MINVNWADVVGGFIVLALAGMVVYAYLTLDNRRIRAQERHDRRQFEQDMASTELPAWNGDTYDWTPQELAGMSDTAVYAGPGVADTAALPVLSEAPTVPVPASTVSGPLPVITSPAVPEDPDDFLAKMRADTEAFMAKWDITPVEHR